MSGADADHAPRFLWTPSAAEIAASNVGRLMADRGLATVAELHAWSVRDRAAFWGELIRRLGIRLRREPEAILDATRGPEHARWLPGAELNIVESCFQAPPAAPALAYHAPGAPPVTLTCGELRVRVAQTAAALRGAGFSPGDALAIAMPMNVEAVIAYLGIVAAGMTVVSIADSLAAPEVAVRLRLANAAGLVTAYEIDRAGKRLPHYRKLLDAEPPRAIVVGAPDGVLRPGDVTWDDFLRPGRGAAFAALLGRPDDTTNVLFSSGTTGEPKAIPWTHLTPIKAAADGHLHLDVRPGDVVAWPTNLGWMMGPWLIYAALINRATIALFGDAPTTRDFGRFVQDAGVTMLGVVPSIVKAWRADDRMRGLDWSRVRCFGSTGEASNADDYAYLMELAGGRPVIEYCGGTELGGGYVSGTIAQPAAPATFSTPAFGSAFVILDERGTPADRGEVFLIPPTLGYSQRLLHRDHHEIYFAGAPRGPGGEILRRHGDELERLPGGYFRAHGRTDDTMNLGGIKVSSVEIERVCDRVPGIARSAAIAVDPPGGGPSELVLYVQAASASPDPGALRSALQDAIKRELNPLFRVADLIVVDALRVTTSNKVMRRELRADYRARRGTPG